MIEEKSTLREKRKYNNTLVLNKNYFGEFSFNYNPFILGKKIY